MALILFDFDGVLADTLSDMLRFAQETCDELGIKHVVKQEDLSSLEVMSFATYGQNCEVPEHLLDEFVRGCLKRFAEKESPPDIFEGLSEVIKALTAKNSIAIVTGNTTQNVNAFLIEHGLNESIRAVYGVDAPGSKAEKILQAQNQFAAGNEAVYMVGDSVSDIRAAREADVQSIAVNWGHQSAEMLIQAKPDSFIHSPQELLELIR